jgi:hypothetical protein
MHTLTSSAVLVLVAVWSAACSGADRPPSAEVDYAQVASSRSGSGSDPAARNDVATGPCDSLSSRDCQIWLPSVNNIKNCFVGTQVCSDGEWSDCLSDDAAAALLGD